MKRTTTMWTAFFWTRVDELRRWRGMSEEELAEKAGIPYRKLMKFKSDGAKADMSMDYVWSLSDALKVSPVAFFTEPKRMRTAKGKKKSE